MQLAHPERPRRLRPARPRETVVAAFLEHALPDVLRADRHRFAGRHTLRIVAATGFRPDHSIAAELRLDLDPMMTPPAPSHR